MVNRLKAVIYFDINYLEKFKNSTEIIIYQESPIPSLMFFKVYPLESCKLHFSPLWNELLFIFLWCQKEKQTKNQSKQHDTITVRRRTRYL